MTLCERTKLIDDMIRENPDATIKDYFELMGEVNKIERATLIKPPIAVLKEKEKERGIVRPRKKKPYGDAKYLNNYRIHF